MRIDAVNNLKPAAVTPPATSPARPAEVVVAPVQAADPEALNKAVKEANEIAAKSASGVEFSIDKDSGQTVIRVRDTLTNEVIRQFPSEDLLKLRHAMDSMRGLLISQRA